MMSADVMYSQHQQQGQGSFQQQGWNQQVQRPATVPTPVQQHQHQQHQQQQHQHHQSQPCGAGFGFDGKLVQYFNVKPDVGIGGLPYQHLVTISNVVTLPEFVARTERLDYALESGTLGDFCREKSQEVTDPSESKVWEFLQASFSPTPPQAYLSILGYESNQMFSKLHNIMESKKECSDSMTDGFVTLGRGVPDGYISNQSSQNGDIESESHAPHVHDGDKELIDIPTDESAEGLINQALLSGNTEIAVDLCLQNSRWEDALILASTGGQELIKKTQLKYFQKRAHETSNMIVAVVTRDLRRVVEHCDLRCWKEALATALTYSDPLGFSYLAETLGRRLGSSEDEDLKKCALLCYICCGHINHLVESWASLALECADESDNPNHLQDAVEQLLILKKIGELHGKEFQDLDRILSEKLVKYGSLLVSQGSLKTALKYISDSTDPSVIDLKQRVEYVLGLARPAQAPSAVPTRARSRQPSESSKYPLTKRPSYPIPGQGQMSPGLSSSAYDRRMSAYSDGPNISSLTGPPVPPVHQPMDPMGGGGYYNPLNVNTTMTTPAGYGQQVTPLGGAGGGASYYGGGGGYNPDRRPSATSLPPPPAVSNVPHGWNDPPPLKQKSKPVGATPQAVDAITHPIFGSAAPEPQSMYSPYGAGDSHASGSLLGYAGTPPVGLPPTGRMGPPPSMGSNPYGSPPGPMQATVPQYGMPPPPSTFMPPQSGSAYNPPPPGPTTFQPPPISGFAAHGSMPPPPSMYAPPTKSEPTTPPYGALPPTGRLSMSQISPPTQTSNPYGAPPSMQSVTQQYGGMPPPTMQGSSYNAPPPSTFQPTPVSGFGPPSFSTPSYGLPPSQNQFAPPPASNFGPPPTSSFAPPPTSNFAPPQSSNFAPPQSSNFAPPPNSNFAPPPSSNFAPPSNFGPPPSSNSAPPSSNFGPPSSNSAPPSSNFGPSPSSNFAPPPTSNFAPLPTSNFAPPPAKSSFGSQQTMPGGPLPQQMEQKTSRPPSVPLEDQFSHVNLNSPHPPVPPPVSEEAEEAKAGEVSDGHSGGPDPTAPPVTAFGPPFAPPADEAINHPFPQQIQPTSNANPFLSQSYQKQGGAQEPVTPIYAPPPPKSEPGATTPTFGGPVKSEPPAAPSGSTSMAVPAEFAQLVKSLDDLRSICYSHAQPAVKRKLEDIARKLEILAEKLREGSLSSKTLSSLTKMAEAVQHKDYQLALGIHTQLVTSGNFSEISSFLPAIKALIQTAAQLGV